jgi:hypothetical protein
MLNYLWASPSPRVEMAQSDSIYRNHIVTGFDTLETIH